MRKYLKKIHLYLSAELGDAIKATSQDEAYIKILFLAQILTIGSLFITNGSVGHLVLIYLLMPILFFPARFSLIKIRGIELPIPTRISLYNIFRNTIICRTPLFLAVAIYGATKAYLSYLYPEALSGYLHIFFYYLLAPLLAFIVATMRLSVDQSNFYYLFFRLMSPIVALNAVINFYLFLLDIPSLSTLGSNRLQSSFASAMGYNPNLDALIHATFLIGIIITILQSRSKYDDFLSIPSIVILFCSLVFEQSRASSLAMVTSLFIYIYNFRPFIDRKIIFLLASLAAFIFLYAYLFLPNGFNTYFLRSDHIRFELWQIYLKLIIDKSFIGFGDRFIFIIPLSNGEFAPHPHSILLSSLVRGGIVGLFSMLFITITGLIKSFLYAKKSKNAVPFCVFLTVIIAGLFDFDLKVWQAGWYLAGYWLAIALVLGADANLKNKERDLSN